MSDVALTPGVAAVPRPWPRTSPPPTAATAREHLDATLLRVTVDRPLGEVLHDLADASLAALPGARGVALVLTRGTRRVVAASVVGSGAAALDERQEEPGWGPCLGAARSGGEVHVVTAAETVLVGFAAAARRQGVGAAVGVPLPAGPAPVGALGVYAPEEDALGEGCPLLERSRAVAAALAPTAHNLALHARAVEQVEQLHEAMRSRAVIEQAKGVLVARCGITAEEAFERLSRASQDTNVKLRVAAEHLVREATAAGAGSWR
jgi:hypothetical protein